MCKETIEHMKVLNEKTDNLSKVISEMADDRKKSKELLFQLAINQKTLQEQMISNNKEHQALGEKIDEGFSDIKKSLNSKTLDINKNTSFREKALGVLMVLGFLGSGTLLAFLRGTG